MSFSDSPASLAKYLAHQVAPPIVYFLPRLASDRGGRGRRADWSGVGVDF